ncbi:hypothetical protein LINPERHAP2_LOCUS33220 [Linum perenne]
MDLSPSRSSCRSNEASAKALPTRTTPRLKTCAHNREAILMVARTKKNNGRSFYRCPYWEESTTDCEFFKWADEKPKVEHGSSTTGDNGSDLDVCLDELRSIRVTLERGLNEIRFLLLFVSFLGLGFACWFTM